MTDSAMSPNGVLAGRNRGIGLALIGLGLATAAAALGIDLVRIGRSQGIGLLQTMAALAGLAIAAHGMALAAPAAPARALLPAERVAALGRFGATLGQLLLFMAVAQTFQLENPAFYRHIVPLAVFGFAVHHFLPVAYRLPFFVVLSVGGLVQVLGEANAAWVVVIVLAFVGIARLPISFGARVLLTVALGVTLAGLRSGSAPWSAGIWPVLGSMLMFRLIVFMYDVKHAATPPTVSQALAYFFLLPNVVFPLFPVVDFATFCRTHFDRDPYQIYQVGLRWILRGVTHLLIYRVIYQHFTLAPEEVSSTGDLVRYLLSTFGLYLRVSGQFHVIVGLLHLFGFRLPETHHLFYLSSSFTDFWRRINIYWKDFMMKVVFYPVYFPARKKVGDTTALVIGTAIVFAVTWVTHSYQWFWILGSWLLSWTDGIFWAILGVFLVTGSLREMKKGRVRPTAMTGWDARYALKLAARTALTFTIICVLWSMWGSHTFGEWFDLITVRAPSAAEVLLVAAVIVTIGVLAVVADLLERRAAAAARGKKPVSFTWASAAATAAGFALLYAAASPLVLEPLGVRARTFMRDLRVPELSKRDAARMQRGYYENLTGVGNQNSQLWELYAQRPALAQDIWSSGALRERADFLGREMNPLFVRYQTGLTFTTNQWGMRDQEYRQLPPAGTRRIALMGQSYVAGDGVTDGQTFEQLVEDRLNERSGVPRTEILNFAVGSYSVPQQLALLPRVLTFRPEVVILVGNPVDPDWAARHLVNQIRRGVEPPYEPLRALLQRAEVDGALRETEALSRLKPYRDSILDFSYRQFIAEARQAGARPVWIYLATPERGPGPEDVQRLIAGARAAGFDVLDWSGVYDGHDLATLHVSPWDFHPNAEGHRLIADRFYQDLTAVLAPPTGRN